MSYRRRLSSDTSEDATSAIAPIARKHKRPPLLADDLERMTMLMAQQGVFGSPDLFHSLLDAFEQLQHQHQAQPQGSRSHSLVHH